MQSQRADESNDSMPDASIVGTKTEDSFATAEEIESNINDSGRLTPPPDNEDSEQIIVSQGGEDQENQAASANVIQPSKVKFDKFKEEVKHREAAALLNTNPTIKVDARCDIKDDVTVF